MYISLVWPSSSMSCGNVVMHECSGFTQTDEQLVVGGIQDGLSGTKWSCELQVTISTHLVMRNGCCNVGTGFWMQSKHFWTWEACFTFTVEASHAGKTTTDPFHPCYHKWRPNTTDFFSSSKGFFSPCPLYFSPMLLTYCLSFPIPIWQGLRLWAIV